MNRRSIGWWAATALAVTVALAVVVRGRGGYRRGGVLAYLPEACPAARVYVDVAALSRTLGPVDLTGAGGQRGVLRDLVVALEAAGIDPARDVHDFALCAEELGEDEDERSVVHVAVGGALGGGAALSRYKSVIMALSHVDAASVVESRQDGVPYLVSRFRRKRMWIAMPAPDVLVFSTEDVAEVARLRTPHPAHLDAWGAGPGVTASFDYVAPGRGPAAGVKGGARDDRGVLVLEGAGRFAGAAGLDARKLETIRAGTVAVLERSPLAPLAAPVRQMSLAVVAGELRATLGVPGPAFARLLGVALTDPSVVKRVVLELTKKPAAP